MMLVVAWTGMAQEVKPAPAKLEDKKEGAAVEKPAPTPAPVVKPEAKKEAAPVGKVEGKEMVEKKKEAAKPSKPRGLRSRRS